MIEEAGGIVTDCWGHGEDVYVRIGTHCGECGHTCISAGPTEECAMQGGLALLSGHGAVGGLGGVRVVRGEHGSQRCKAAV